MENDLDKSFLGTGWAFPPEFSLRDRSASMVSEDDDIHQSLRILFNTETGERVMLPAYGCGLRPRVFELMNDSTITEIKDLVERAVLFFEPRITVNDISVKIDDAASGRLLINLSYTIRTTNTRSNLVYPFYFVEATMVPAEHRALADAAQASEGGEPDGGAAA